AKLESVNEVKAELKDAYKSNETQVQVNFTNKIAVPTKDNFSIEGLTISDVKITDDQKSVLLTVSGMELDKTYTVAVKNIIDANGKAVADGKVDFVARKITYKADMDIVDVKTGKSITEIKSDGKETAKFVVTLKDDAGNVIKDNAEIRFTTTAGNFAETKVSAQSGVATNIFTSEISSTKKDALVTATVVASDNKDLINIDAKRILSMNPNVDTNNNGASLTDVMVETCDRVILYFNKDVNVTDYTKNDDKNKYKYDSSKLEITIGDNAGTAETVEGCKQTFNPMALAPVPDNPKALYAILDVDTKDNILTDNSKAIVKITDKTKAVPTTESKSTYVTDVCNPSMLSVTNPNKSLRKIEITFSEPVQNRTKDNSAEDLEKWVIDNIKLNDERYGVSYGKGVQAKAEVGTFNDNTGKDTRNVVTITLGKDKDGDQIYFPAGSHSVQGNKIGDWANVKDTLNNIINTQTLDFVIEANEAAPTANVTVESPEQYDVKFSTPVSINDLNGNLKLQKYEDGTWKDVSGNPISIRQVKDTDDEFIVELKDDWTNILNTKESKKNYYNFNFRLFLNKDVVKNELNGLKNAEISLELNDKIMKEPDVTSTEMTKVTIKDNAVFIDMSEPVQISVDGNRTLTPKEEQGTKLSEPIVQFISSGDKETIQGHIVDINDHDNQIKVVPDSTISTGTWKVVVRNVSDDVGNTSPTLVEPNFVVDKPIVSDGFKVLWVVAVKANNTDKDNPITLDKENDVDYKDEDVIYVKFNKKIKTYGNTANAGATTNYTVNGNTLPTTSKIDSSVKDYNENAVTKNGYSDIVAIHLKDALTDSSNTINISEALESAVGEQLSNGGRKLLTKDSILGTNVFVWNYEEFNNKTVDSNAASVINVKVKDLQNYFDEGIYKDYDLSNVDFSNDTAEHTFTLKHTTPVNFAGKTVKDLKIETQETGKLIISNVIADTITINAPNADVVFRNVTAKTVNVKDILDGSLVLDSAATSGGNYYGVSSTNKITIDELNVTDANAGAVEVKGANVTVTNFTIDTTGTITLKVDKDFKGVGVGGTFKNRILVKKACTLNVQNATSNNVEITVDKDVNLDNMKITGIVVTGTPKIEVYTYDSKTKEYAKNGTIVKTEVQGAEFSTPVMTDGAPEASASSAVAAKTTLTVNNAGSGERSIKVLVAGPGNESNIVPVALVADDDNNDKVAGKISDTLNKDSKISGAYKVTVEGAVVTIEATKAGKGDITAEILSNTESVTATSSVVVNGKDEVKDADATAGTATFEVTKGSELAGTVTVHFSTVDSNTSVNVDVEVNVSVGDSMSKIAENIANAINAETADGKKLNSSKVVAKTDGNKVIITSKATGSSSKVVVTKPTFKSK
ncbi:MAG: hypothetical protein MR409_04925, partial [Lachnospiraceae bacterium]|nr:hypothetical protein [Lachnospiraceae bacterium]